jgi:hypothetical protein
MNKRRKTLILPILIVIVAVAAIGVSIVFSSDMYGSFLGKKDKEASTGADNSPPATQSSINLDVNDTEKDYSEELPNNEKSTEGSEVKSASNGDADSNTQNGALEEIGRDKPVDSQADEIKTIKAKAIYLSGNSAGSEQVLDKYISLINTTELNAVVIDIKEAGKVNYRSSIPFVSENNLDANYYDPKEVLTKLHENGIFVIGRIVCFRDDGLARARPDLAIKRVDGSIWKEGKLGAWTNPYSEDVWDYNIKIAEEAIDLGFDEIQFDYVRFPTAKKSEVSYGDNMPTRIEAINNFLKKASEKIRDEKKTPLSADIFGIVAESVTDGRTLGQELESIGMNIDHICPMVYPSHYAKGQIVNGVVFEKPDFDPYGVVYQTLLKTKNRLSQVEGYKATVRPYLQDFTASYLPDGDYQQYGAKQVREQIQAVYDAGYDEWILWDGRNRYTEAALGKE